MHWPDPNTPIGETAAAMADLYRAGKIRAIGVSNFSPAQMDEFRAAAPLHTVQPPYNLFERAIENDVLPYCRQSRARDSRIRVVVPWAFVRADDVPRRSFPVTICATTIRSSKCRACSNM